MAHSNSPLHLSSTLGQMQPQVPFSRPSTPRATALQIGFYGLGSMGYPMAMNLALHQSSSHSPAPLLPLLVYNRTKSKAEALVKEVGGDKARVAKDLEELVQRCDVIIANLVSDAVVKATYEEFHRILQAQPPAHNKIFVETSTIYPTLAGEIDLLMSEIPHVHFVMCPVFGPPAAAKARKLLLVLAGDYKSKKEVAHVLVPAIGVKAMDLGGNIEKAPTLKLIGNSYILGTIELLAENMTLAEKSGVGADQFAQLINDFFPSPTAINYSQKMLHDEFDGKKGFAIDGGIKDATHIRALTLAHNCPVPSSDLAFQNLLTARALHNAEVARGTETFDVLDWSALVAGPRLAAGLDALDSKKHSRVMRED